jgi:multisubunit Na+/H+ antiporter MnhG subunit
LLRAEVADVVFVLFSFFIIDFYSLNMAKTSPVSVFLAATSLLIASASTSVVAQAQSAGGLQEWSTDQAVDEESIPDSDAKALKKKAIAEDVCVPIGEGENCW